MQNNAEYIYTAFSIKKTFIQFMKGTHNMRHSGLDLRWKKVVCVSGQFVLNPAFAAFLSALVITCCTEISTTLQLCVCVWEVGP